jgi:beta-galactosidase
VLNALHDAGLTSADQQLPASVRLKHGIGRDGRSLHYYLNYSSQPATLTYTYAAGTDLLTGHSLSQNQQITVAPWNLVIAKEQ